MDKRRLKTGFTLLELLVVIAVIAMLASLLLPALTNAREMGRRMKCASNLKQLGLAIMMYADDYGGWGPGTVWALDIYNGGYAGKNHKVFFCPSYPPGNRNPSTADFGNRTYGYNVACFSLDYYFFPNLGNIPFYPQI